MSRDTEPRVATSDEPTIARRPNAAKPRSSPPDSGVRFTGAQGDGGRTPLPNTVGTGSTGSGLSEVLETEEATRAHGLSAAMALVSLSVVPFIGWIGGDPVRAELCRAALFS